MKKENLPLLTSEQLWNDPQTIEYRLTDPYQVRGPHFFKLIDALTPFKSELEEWSSHIPKESHIISLAAGSLTPETKYMKTAIKEAKTITAINHPNMSQDAYKRFERHSISTPLTYIHHDLNHDLPHISLPNDQNPISAISILGITYLNDQPLKRIFQQIKTLGVGRETNLDIITLDGPIDPKVLAPKYIFELFPHAVLGMLQKESGVFSTWIQGLISVPGAIKLGKNLEKAEDVCVRTGQETIDLIQSWGFQIKHTQSMLYNQMTAISVSLNT